MSNETRLRNGLRAWPHAAKLSPPRRSLEPVRPWKETALVKAERERLGESDPLRRATCRRRPLPNLPDSDSSCSEPELAPGERHLLAPVRHEQHAAAGRRVHHRAQRLQRLAVRAGGSPARRGRAARRRTDMRARGRCAGAPRPSSARRTRRAASRARRAARRATARRRRRAARPRSSRRRRRARRCARWRRSSSRRCAGPAGSSGRSRAARRRRRAPGRRRRSGPARRSARRSPRARPPASTCRRRTRPSARRAPRARCRGRRRRGCGGPPARA